MVFSSIIFLLYFLPICLFIYFIFSKSNVLRNLVLLIFSLAFYYFGEQLFLYVLLVSTISNYIIGLAIEKFDSKIPISLGIILNLSILLFYKYLNFFFEIVNLDDIYEKIHLPLGISFFTFQGISYIIDVHRKEVKPEKNFLNLALYISMFPQLVAGPIVRYKTIVAEIKSRTITYAKIEKGITIFILGLSYKVILSNTIAPSVDKIFSLHNSLLSTTTAWFGAFLYSLQIYFDFHGYSMMAIGLGLIFGFHFPINFNLPYISKSITEFWRRWHITLSTWFKDYLYIPLGGNRKGKMNTYRNLLIVFMLCGLWHGAQWTFLIWGMYHGLFLILERKLKKTGGFIPIFPLNHILNLIIILIGWVIFRANDLDHCRLYLKGMFSFKAVDNNIFQNISNEVWLVILISVICSTPALKYLISTKYALTYESYKLGGSVINKLFYLCLLFICICILSTNSFNPFIYFRF